MQRWWTFGSYLMAICALAACQPKDTDTQPKDTDTKIVAADSASLDLSQCTPEQFSYRGTRKDFQCGKLRVAENPQGLDLTQTPSRTIELNIVRLPAISSSPKPDPIFVLAGGPGQASTEIVASVSPWLRLVNRERDVVFVDQRGTGQSNPLDCDLETDSNYTASSEELSQAQERILEQCLNSYDADLRFYTTPFAADDINAVREALGYSQMNLWGGSYGTRLALEIMRRHTDKVRSAVLDGVAPIGISLPEFVLRDADQSMRRIIALCESNPVCAEAYPDLAATLQHMIRHYDNEPQTITAVHPLRGESFSIRLEGQSIAGLLRLGLYARDIAPTLPLIIDAAAQENFGPLLTLLSMSEEINSGISVGLQQTILCAEDVSRIDSSDATDDSLLQLQVIEPAKAVCEYWPKGQLPDDFFVPVSSNIPTLLLSGEFDPVTPPAWGERAAESLSQFRHLVVQGAHHGVSTLGCVPDIIDQFYTGLMQEEFATTCIRSIQALPPFSSPAGPAMRKE